uniref:(California timema) hypothetical protein n=1 Tax=Timema californicum TaxID=61474 RepID=A0A7R9JAV8_TIMCA|nr:unnamed protein product [Timema californicum]
MCPSSQLLRVEKVGVERRPALVRVVLPTPIPSNGVMSAGHVFQEKNAMKDDSTIVQSQAHYSLVTEHRSSYSSLRLSDHFNRPEIIEEGENFDHLIRGMTTQSQECTDQYFTSEITRYLFRNGKETGQDLRAIDIQRGRDHGLASYNDYRHYCGLHRADKFSDFGDYISQEGSGEPHMGRQKREWFEISFQLVTCDRACRSRNGFSCTVACCDIVEDVLF